MKPQLLPENLISSAVECFCSSDDTYQPKLSAGETYHFANGPYEAAYDALDKAGIGVNDERFNYLKGQLAEAVMRRVVGSDLIFERRLSIERELNEQSTRH